MAEQRVPSQWQLQDTGESLEQWKLQDDEQRLPSHLELQDDLEGQGMGDAAWHPIDYRAMQAAASSRPRRAGAALGALLVVALLGVGGYLAWFYMGQPNPFGAADTANAEAQATTDASRAATTAAGGEQALAPGASVTGTIAATQTAPAAAAPPLTATVPAAEPVAPTPLPTVAPTVQVRQAVMNSAAGVNLRATPAVTGNLLATLDNQSTAYVAGGPTADAAGGNWYEIVTPAGQRGWANADFITVTVQTLPYDQAAAILTPLGIALPALENAAAPAAPSTVTTTVAAPAVGAEPTIRLSAVISAPAGLNLRSAAVSAPENVIRMLDNATPVTVIGRSADGAWLLVELADKTRGWVSASFTTVTGDLNTIPLGTTFPLTPTTSSTVSGVAAASAPSTTSAAVSAATTITPAASTALTPTAAPAAADVAAAGAFTVTNILGVNLRPQPVSTAPSIVQLSWNTSGKAVGRSADSAWIQVTIPTGQSGWVAAMAVTLERDVATLPVVNP